MLREQVDEAGGSQPSHAALPEARRVLETAVRNVLDAPDADEVEWVRDKDRSAAERARLAIADVLAGLRQ